MSEHWNGGLSCKLNRNRAVDSTHTEKAESSCYLCELAEQWKQIKEISSSIGSNIAFTPDLMNKSSQRH